MKKGKLLKWRLNDGDRFSGRNSYTQKKEEPCMKN